MKIKKFDIFLANLNPPFGTKPGKVRPVVIVQTDGLNNYLASTIVCPLTTALIDASTLLRVRIKANKETGLEHDSDVLIDQILAIDNSRLINQIGIINKEQHDVILRNLSSVILE